MDMQTLPQQAQNDLFDELLSRVDNAQCADCGDMAPKWVSTAFGVFICNNCAGHHRNLGTTITKVRSVKLDTWSLNQIKQIQSVGNCKANAYWEARLTSKKPNAKGSTLEIRKYIQDKYIKRMYATTDVPNPMTAATLNCGKGTPEQITHSKTTVNQPATFDLLDSPPEDLLKRRQTIATLRTPQALFMYTAPKTQPSTSPKDAKEMFSSRGEKVLTTSTMTKTASVASFEPMRYNAKAEERDDESDGFLRTQDDLDDYSPTRKSQGSKPKNGFKLFDALFRPLRG